MKYRSLLLCLSILVMVFSGCSSSQQSSVDEQIHAAVEQALAAEQAKVAEQARAAEQAKATEDALARAEQAREDAERALAIARQANSAEQARAAAEAKAKADAEHAKAIEEARLAAEAKAIADAEQAKAAEARAAAERAREAAAKQAREDSRQQTKVQTVTLPAGTPVEVVTSDEISTQTGKTGDEFIASLTRDIADGDRIIARRGSTVKGVISESDPGGRVRGVALISLRLTRLTLTDGTEIAITTNEHHEEASSSVGKDVATTGIGAGIGAAIGAIAGGGRGAAIGAAIGGAGGAATALATHGNPAVVNVETPLTFNLDAPLTVSLQQESGGRRR